MTIVARIIFSLLLCASVCGAQAQNSGCLAATKTDVREDAARMWWATRSVPRAMVRPHNLKWELPIAAASAVLITSADSHVARQFTSPTTISDTRKASNAALGAEILLAAVPYVAGCAGGREHARHAGLAALEGMGYALGAGEVLKLATNRQRPDIMNARGSFWEGGKSFPSGHASATWGAASVLAHEYPDKRWVKWTAYGLAATASLLRIPARKHFPSDVLVGGTLGYLVGTTVSAR